MVEAGQATGEVDTAGGSKYKQILGLKAVHFLAIWALIYVGVEVTLGGKLALLLKTSDADVLAGWIVTFIEQRRGGGATAGYISSGFFGGKFALHAYYTAH